MVHTHDVFSVVAYVAVSYTTHKYNTTSTPKAVILLCRSAHKPDAAVPVTSDVWRHIPSRKDAVHMTVQRVQRLIQVEHTGIPKQKAKN